MVAKELIDARWKAVIGTALSVMLVLVGAFTYDLVRRAISPEQLNQASQVAGVDLASRLSNYAVYVWGQTFSVASNSGVVLILVAALLGASMIAGEVSKGTFFLLLSRPLSRDRILLTKYLVGAVVLLGMGALTGIVLLVASLI